MYAKMYGEKRKPDVITEYLPIGKPTGIHPDAKPRAGVAAAPEGQDAKVTKRAARILSKKLGRQPTTAEIAKKSKALAKKAAAKQAEDEGEATGTPSNAKPRAGVTAALAALEPLEQVVLD